MATNWYYHKEGKMVGPLSSEKLRHLAETGEITDSTKIQKGEFGRVIFASKMRGLLEGQSPKISMLSSTTVGYRYFGGSWPLLR